VVLDTRTNNGLVLFREFQLQVEGNQGMIDQSGLFMCPRGGKQQRTLFGIGLALLPLHAHAQGKDKTGV